MKEQKHFYPTGKMPSKFTIELQRRGRWTPSNRPTWRAQMAAGAQTDPTCRHSAGVWEAR